GAKAMALWSNFTHYKRIAMRPVLVMTLGAALLLWGCKREKSTEDELGHVEIKMVHMANGDLLQMDRPGTNPHGEPFTVTNFAYYISHIELESTQGPSVKLPVEYYLVNEKVPASRTISIMPPKGEYRSISWLLGVDSTRNVSGVQSGALDPANGMFWSWNTGYIFAKLEGRSPVSTAPLQNVTYHIGGFRQGENALRTVTLTFPETLVVQARGHHSGIEVWANVDAWFNAVQPLTIAAEPSCMTPGPLAQKIADNYAHMFQVRSVTN
ncbi:MAG TPA: MbnP family protein, partial [Phnomibacter sp.]|nr:MbnP family protein [Phnomibacter sp.]